MIRNLPTGISLPRAILERIDKERGDVTRSRYIQRMIEAYYKEKD